MIARASLAASLLLPLLAAAQAPPADNPNQEARRVAERLGRERNVEGLRVILESRNVDLIAAYDSGMRHGPVGPKMSAGMEALLVRFHDDPVVGGAARVLATWDHPQTRAYCEKLIAEWRSGSVRRSTYPMRDSALKCEAPGTEAALREWIGSPRPPDAEDLRQIVSFLGRRHDAQAVPVLARLDFGPALEIAPAIVAALLDIGTPEAGEAALARLAELKRIGGGRPEEARRVGLQRLASEPDKLAIPYALFRRYEPEAARASAATWLAKRKDPDALDDTFALLSATPPRYDAVQALVATNDVATWRRARDEVERLHRAGAWDAGHYRFAAAELDRKLADPAAHFAQQEAQRRYQAYQQAVAPIMKARSEASAARAGDPARGFDALRALALRQEVLARENGIDARAPYGGVAADLARQFHDLADFARFRLGRPGDAVALYESAERWGFPYAALPIADTQEWDLRNRDAALLTYRRIAAGARTLWTGDGPGEARVRGALLHWVRAQETWLAEGRRFRGEIDEADLATAALVATFGAMLAENGPVVPRLPPASPESLVRELDAVPPSGAAFLATALAMQYLPGARAIRAHAARMDPAGFSTAAFFVLVQHLDPVRHPEGMSLFPDLARDRSPRHALRVAAREFLRERGIVDRVPDRPLR